MDIIGTIIKQFCTIKMRKEQDGGGGERKGRMERKDELLVLNLAYSLLNHLLRMRGVQEQHFAKSFNTFYSMPKFDEFDFQIT